MEGFEFFSLFIIDEIEKATSLRNRRRFKAEAAQDPLFLPDQTFIDKFAISKEMFYFLRDELKSVLKTQDFLGRISLDSKILIALRFYATGNNQKLIADDVFVSVSQVSVSRCIHQISRAINEHLLPKYMKFPTTQEEQSEVQNQFLKLYGFPNVLGVIDSMNFAVKRLDACCPNLINSKGTYTLKVQMVTDSSMRILGINSDSPLGTDDKYIWYKNEIREALSIHQNEDLWLLGDNNFPLEPWLLTPFENPGESESVFNEKHQATRECMRKCKRILKSRFKCLAKDLSNYAPSQVSQIVNACAVLHNLCLLKNVPFNLPESVDEVSDDYEANDSDDFDNETNDNNDENIDSDIIHDMASFTRQRILKDFF